MAELISEYKTTCSFEEQADVALAKRFISACRALLVLRPTAMRHGAEGQEFDPDVVERQLQDAQRFVALNRTDKQRGSLRVDLSCLRW